MTWRRLRSIFVSQMVLFTLTFACSQTAVAQEADEELSRLTLEELLDLPIVSASNVEEKLSQAPATVVVLTAQQLRERGYQDLSEIFDDLPGMDVSRPYGATYFKNYWRGYRNNIGDPYLLLVDGVVFNHLYFNTADLIAALPIAGIERVEVVYGPASSVYGANAFMGVVNVITTTARIEGDHSAVSLTGGEDNRRIADVAYSFTRGDFRFRLNGRFENGELDPDAADRYEYTSRRYYRDRRLWGGFIDNPSIAGNFRSERRHRAIDLRAEFGGLEVGAQYFVLDSGYGLEYAADRAQNDAIWKRPDLSLYARHTRNINAELTSRTLIRYRESDVANDSFFIERNPVSEADGTVRQLVDFSYWQSLNSSWSLLQDFDWKVSDRLLLAAGVKYEQKELQKAYDVAYGPALPAEAIDAATYPYPRPPTESAIASNRITTDDEGLYAQGWYALTPAHRLNVGLRWDHNSQYGQATTLRAGYVGHAGPWTVKALLGQAFQEPTPRLLYGGWTGSGSDPELGPERSRTAEVSGGWSRGDVSALLSVYHVRNDDTIINTATGAENVGTRRVVGYDLHLQNVLKGSGSTRLTSWFYYSRILRAEEETFSLEAVRLVEGRIGDLASNKVIAGATLGLPRGISTTLRGRYIGARPTVVTNPVREVPSYLTVDAVAAIDDIRGSGIGLSLTVNNLTDEDYFHPGTREASAGREPGRFDDAGNWSGSAGFFNSLLPQPGRSVLLTLRFAR